jgi:hypothetical protein
MVAQSKNKKKPTSAAAKKKARTETKKNEDSFWTTKMWYGADINYPQFGNGIFQMSLNPMAAYKINDRFSAGVLTKLDYYWFRLNPNSAGLRSYENLNYGAGVFARARLFRGLFAHVEYERSHFKQLFDDGTGAPLIDLNTNKVYTENKVEPYCYTGLGWSSGFGKWQTQIGIYRNLLDDVDKIRNVWDFRFGISYNF